MLLQVVPFIHNNIKNIKFYPKIVIFMKKNLQTCIWCDAQNIKSINNVLKCEISFHKGVIEIKGLIFVRTVYK